MNEATNRKFFHEKVCRWVTGLSKVWINLPHNEAELRHFTVLYKRVGLPGCVWSIDCVHLVWDKCPAGFLSACKGKENIPTLEFQCVTSFTKTVLSMYSFFAGTTNDKTISRFDPVIKNFEVIMTLK